MRPIVFLLLFTPLSALAQAPVVEVLSPHWVALRFEPQFPHGRHTQNPLPGDSLTLPLPESQMIKGQAGQNSDNKINIAEYRIPVPDFVADAGVVQAFFLADFVSTSHGDMPPPLLDGVPAKRIVAKGDPFDRLRHTVPPNSAPFHTWVIDSVPSTANPAEFTIELRASADYAFSLHGADGEFLGPTLLLRTREVLPKPTGYTSTETSGVPFPAIKPLFDQFLRDTSIVLAPDGNYYMTGTTGGPEMMVVTSDLSVWKSPDLTHWSPVRDKPRQSTVVWNMDRDGSPWIKPITLRDGEPFRPLWAPEIHYLNKTFWIPFSVPRHGVTLLKSTTGNAEGPYEVAIKPDEPISTGIDASLFQDDDGATYFLYGGGWIARMKPDLSGLAEPFRHITSASGREVGFEGVYLFKDHGLYHLCTADFVLGDYNTYIATATSLNGPWSERYLAVPHAGHANFFRDKQGRMWSTFFGNDRHSPLQAKPAIVPMLLDAKGRWRPDPNVPNAATSTLTTQLPGAIGPSNGQPQHVGIMPTKP